MKLLHKITTLMLGIFATCSVASCGGQPSSPTTVDPTTAEPTTTTVDPTSQEPTTPEKSIIYDEMPENYSYNVGDQIYYFGHKDIDGNEHYIDLLINNKELVVINFFATWCEPCVMELPFFEQYQQENADKVQILVYSTEVNDNKGSLSRFKERNNLSLPFILYDLEFLLPFFNTLNSEGKIPFTICIDRYGTLVSAHIGMMMSYHMVKSSFDQYLGNDYVSKY